MSPHEWNAADYAENSTAQLNWARELMEIRPELNVAVAFHHGAPSFAACARRISGGQTTVLPLMTSDGFYARQRLVPEWSRAFAGSGFVVAPPLGVTPGFRAEVVRQVTGAVADFGERHDAPAVVLMGHGTTKVTSSATS